LYLLEGWDEPSGAEARFVGGGIVRPSSSDTTCAARTRCPRDSRRDAGATVVFPQPVKSCPSPICRGEGKMLNGGFSLFWLSPFQG